MNMKKINSGRLRAIGYDAAREGAAGPARRRQHTAVRRRRRGSLAPVQRSSAAWSFYRDNIEEEFAGARVSGKAPAGRNPLDDLFG